MESDLPISRYVWDHDSSVFCFFRSWVMIFARDKIPVYYFLYEINK